MNFLTLYSLYDIFLDVSAMAISYFGEESEIVKVIFGQQTNFEMENLIIFLPLSITSIFAKVFFAKFDQNNFSQKRGDRD